MTKTTTMAKTPAREDADAAARQRRTGAPLPRAVRFLFREAEATTQTVASAIAVTIGITRPRRTEPRRLGYSPPSGSQPPPRASKLDVLTTEPEAEPITGGAPAGVTPVLRALGRIVMHHERSGYAGLSDDERFWTLIALLSALMRHAQPGLEAALRASQRTGEEPGQGGT